MYTAPTPRHGARMYARVGMESTALSASPHQLIAMLFDGASSAIATARHHMSEHRIMAKGAAVSRAINIIENGLKASLDPMPGGEEGERLVNNLAALYDYIVRRLMFANLHNDSAALEESARLLESVGSAWREIDATASHPADIACVAS
jgi:flagellar secretion chaperone FliS